MLLKPFLTVLPAEWQGQIERRLVLFRAAENAGWILVNQFLRLAASILVGVWIARHLGPTQYGMFTYAIAYTSLFAIIVPLGLNSINLRDLAIAPDERYVILGSSLGIQFIAALAVLAVSLVTAFWTQDDELQFTLIVILSVLTLFRPFITLQYWFQSQHASHLIAFANLISLGLMVVVRIALLLTDASVVAFSYVLVLEQTINTGLLVYFYQRSGESIGQWRFDLHHALRATHEGLPFLMTAIASTAYVRGNQIMVKEIAGATANGYFSAAMRISDLWLLVPSALAVTAMPIIARAKMESTASFEAKLAFFLRIGGITGLLGAVAINLFGPWAINLLYGPAYHNAADILIILSWGILPSILQTGIGIWAVNEGRARIVLEKTIAQAVLVLLLNLWLIPRYAGSGAAFSLLIAAILIYFVWDFFDPRLRQYNRIQRRAWFPWGLSAA
jgi:O-antigen/teichoic acid export membrane protein